MPEKELLESVQEQLEELRSYCHILHFIGIEIRLSKIINQIKESCKEN